MSYSQLLPKDNLKTPVVNSFNEWDPLEEVIVGIIDGASVPPWHITLKGTMPHEHWDFFHYYGGRPFPKELITAAKKDLDEFVHILESEGVIVRRPDVIDHSRPYTTPDWTSAGGLYSAMPRDVLLVIGDNIIEAPMAWRSRYFEVNSYRSIIKDYFRRGARWSVAPKPQLTDELYDYTYEDPGCDGPMRYVITEFEPTFDAADFVRCGKDIFYQKSNVTNNFGIVWLSQHLGQKYRLHELKFKDTHPMHIDATFMPLAPGKVLVNPERVDSLPKMFKKWDLLPAPLPCIPDNITFYMSSKWLSMNVLMLDEKRVIVEKHEDALIKSLSNWGFKPISCNFINFNKFGGSFHCATLDIRRRGTLQSYF
jgi:glycine amidinotransferase